MPLSEAHALDERWRVVAAAVEAWRRRRRALSEVKVGHAAMPGGAVGVGGHEPLADQALL
jgi:hypothetical protein